jgi:hypothetical protein
MALVRPGRRDGRNPGSIYRIEQLRGCQRFVVAVSADDQHRAVAQEGRGVTVVGLDCAWDRRPGPARRVIELRGRRGNAEAWASEDDENPAVGQGRRRVGEASLGQGRDDRPRPEARVVDLGGRQGPRVDRIDEFRDPTGDEDAPVGQKRRRRGTGHGHRAGSRPRSRDRIVDLGGREDVFAVGIGRATRDEDPAVPQKRCRVICAALEEVSRRGPGASDRVVELGGSRGDAGSAVRAARDQHAAVG